MAAQNSIERPCYPFLKPLNSIVGRPIDIGLRTQNQNQVSPCGVGKRKTTGGKATTFQINAGRISQSMPQPFRTSQERHHVYFSSPPLVSLSNWLGYE